MAVAVDHQPSLRICSVPSVICERMNHSEVRRWTGASNLPNASWRAVRRLVLVHRHSRGSPVDVARLIQGEITLRGDPIRTARELVQHGFGPGTESGRANCRWRFEAKDCSKPLLPSF